MEKTGCKVTFINNAAEVKKTVQGLEKTALNASGKIIMKKLRENMPIKSKKFNNHIGKWAFIGKADGIPRLQIGFYGWQRVKKKGKEPSNISPWWVEFGAKRHDISARRAKILAYDDTFFGRRVSNPGIRAHHLLRDTVQNNIAEIRAAQEEYLAEITKVIEEAEKRVDQREELWDDD